MKYFKYSLEELIKEVRDRPMIWDKTLETYKDREERKRAWIEIFRILDEDYDRSANKRSIADVIINKWTNVRDTFIRSLKKSKSKKQMKKYVHHDDLSFLIKVVPQEFIISANYEQDSDEDPIASPVSADLKSEAIEDIPEDSVSKEPIRVKQFERKRRFYEMSPEPERRPRRKLSRKSKRHSDSVESPQIDFVDTDHDPRIMNEDEAFFASLLPTVVNYSEDERLEFRIDVLAVMKNISQKRRINKLNDED